MKSIDSVLGDSVFSFSVGMDVPLWLLRIQSQNAGGGCEQGSSSATLTPRGAPNQRKGGPQPCCRPWTNLPMHGWLGSLSAHLRKSEGPGKRR